MMTELERADGNELRDLKELLLKELRRGYVIHRDGTYACIFCGVSSETSVIYHNRGRDVTAKRAIQEHIQEVHSGTFWPMLELDKALSSLTEVQKTLLSCTCKGESTDEIGEIMGINTTTVRTRKFNLQKAKRETKILLALLEILEGKEPPVPRPAYGESGTESSRIEQTDDLFSLSILHPFFIQFRCK